LWLLVLQNKTELNFKNNYAQFSECDMDLFYTSRILDKICNSAFLWTCHNLQPATILRK